MSFQEALLRLARSVLENVISQLDQQFQAVQEQAANPIKAMQQQVMGGLWIGRGADAFVQEIQSLVIPGVDLVGEHITTHSKNLQTARDIIERTEQEVMQLVQSRLTSIYKFY